jgi:ubiquinone/menaquinone biosynthesis C-methylase UbiE
VITVDFSRLPIKPGYRILDIGCGSGRHTCAALRFKNVVVMGMDINRDDALEAQSRLKLHRKLGDHGGGIGGISTADTLALPFKDHLFDLVICAEVLEHISDHRSAVAEIARVLKPGRDLVVSVPRYLPERICWALSENYHRTDNGHVRIYKKKELIQLLETTGARLWAIHYAHSMHTPMLKRPWISSLIEHLLNPVLGKSLVLYFRKEKIDCSL